MSTGKSKATTCPLELYSIPKSSEELSGDVASRTPHHINKNKLPNDFKIYDSEKIKVENKQGQRNVSIFGERLIQAESSIDRTRQNFTSLLPSLVYPKLVTKPKHSLTK